MAKRPKTFSGFKDKVYLNNDIVNHLADKGYDREFVRAFLEFLGDEVRFFAEDSEICDIRIENFCSIFIGFKGVNNEIATVKNLYSKEIIDEKKYKERLAFWEAKKETVRKANEEHYKSYNGSAKYKKRRIPIKNFKQ